LLQRHYKKKVSGFMTWDQRQHSQDYLIYPENIGEDLSIDEVSLSKGELYTFVTNKAAKGKKKSLVAVIKGAKSKDIIDVLAKIPLELRATAKSVSLDMAGNMKLAVKTSFPNAYFVTDRFHVVKLVMDALQHQRIKLRWKVITDENKAIAKAKKNGKKYKAKVLENGDNLKQLLTRSRYLLYCKPDEWTKSQEQRARILFKLFPQLKKGYYHALNFRSIYESKSKSAAEQLFLDWIEATYQLGIMEFNTSANSIKYHLDGILNFFEDRLTNGNAESFNAKIKLFRANQRGVIDVKFFLFRLEKLFA
jgi:transposase